MPAKRVAAVTVRVDGRSGVGFESYPGRAPLLTIVATRPALLVTLTLPAQFDEGHVWFGRGLASAARRYAIDVERSWRGLLALTSVREVGART